MSARICFKYSWRKEKLRIMDHVTDALEQKCFFKLVCGASLTDTKMIEDLCFIFTLAGAHVIDLAPTANVIFAARRGIEKALSIQHSALSSIPSSPHPLFPPSPLLMASIQLDKDPHFRKVEVDYSLCDLCGACVKVCPTEAFKINSVIARNEVTKQSTNDLRNEIASSGLKPFLAMTDQQFVYLNEHCFGCNICPSYCHVNALKMIDTKPSPKQTLQEMISLGIKSIEFHFGSNYKKIEEIWDKIAESCSGMTLLSFSIGSNLLDDEEIKKAANLCYNLAGKGIILQCDGIPMSGGLEKLTKNGNNTGKSCMHVAKVIQEENLPVYLQISGGTNQYSYSQATKSGLNIHGVAIGSYARKLLMPYLSNNEKVNEAVAIAKSLVNSVGSKYEG